MRNVRIHNTECRKMFGTSIKHTSYEDEKHLYNGTKLQGRDVLKILSESFLELWK